MYNNAEINEVHLSKYHLAKELNDRLDNFRIDFQKNESNLRSDKKELQLFLNRCDEVLCQLIRVITQYLGDIKCRNEIIVSYKRYYATLKYHLLNVEGGLTFAVSVTKSIVEKLFHFPRTPVNLSEECSQRLNDNLSSAIRQQSVDDSNLMHSSFCFSASSDNLQKEVYKSCCSPRQPTIPTDGNPYISTASSTSLFRLPSLSDRSEDRIAIPRYLHQSLVESVASLPPSMTLASPLGILHVELCNPFALFPAEYAAEGSQCDTCRCFDVTCGYRAVFSNQSNEDACPTPGPSSFDSTEKCHTGQFVNGRVGFDMCIACACFFFARQRYYLEQCLRPPYHSFSLENAAVKVSKTCFYPCSGGGTLRLQCALSPLGAVPIVWTIGRHAVLNAFSMEGRSENCGSAAPNPDWREKLSVTAIHNTTIANIMGAHWPKENCSICMEPYGDLPVVLSSCHHLFHISCIQDVLLATTSSCPLCRQSNTFPSISGEETLKHNVFNLELRIKEDEHPGTDENYIVCVGALLRPNYQNCTNIGAAAIVKI